MKKDRMKEKTTDSNNDHCEILLGIADMIKSLLQDKDGISDDIFTYCQFIMQQDLTCFSKDDLFRLSEFIRKKIEAVNGDISDEYIIREIIEQDVERIVHPGEETFFDKNVPVVKSVLDKRKINYRERHPGYDRVVFELDNCCHGSSDEDCDGAARAELILDRVDKTIIFRRKSAEGLLLDEEKAEIDGVITEDYIIRLF